MRDMNEGQAQFFLPTAQFSTHLYTQKRIEGRQRLIEQQHPGLHDERSCQRNALLLTARQLRGKALGIRAHSHTIKQSMGSLMTLSLANTAHLQTEGDVVK